MAAFAGCKRYLYVSLVHAGRLLLALAAFAILACSRQAPTPSPVVVPIPTPAMVSTPAPMTIATPAPTQAPTPAPAMVSTPTQTPTPAPTPSPTPVPTPTPAPLPDTVPPAAITGLVAINAYDGRVNLWWDKSTAGDFAHYNIYLSQAEVTDVSKMTPVWQIKDITSTTYQVASLKDGTRYYFAVTAVDKSGNENKRVVSPSVTSALMPRGTKDPDLMIDVYQSDKVWAGITLFANLHIAERPRVIEVNMLGEIIWEYQLPQDLKRYTNPGLDVELLPNNNILLLLPRKGVYEVDRSGRIVWSYLTPKADHDADRLPNGNTIFVDSQDAQKSDAQVVEVNPLGQVVWAWYAKDHFNRPPYDSILEGGWSNPNAVTRLSNGNTLISLRNFHFVVEVDPKGSVVRTIGEGILLYPHDPEIQPNGNVLATSPLRGSVVEIDPKTGVVVWQFHRPGLFPRDADRLPNGNTLITGAAKIVEVATEGKIVWQLTVKGISEGTRVQPGYNYKADRISARK